MKELILNFHGLGEPPPMVGRDEAMFWISVASFRQLLDQVMELLPQREPEVVITFDDGNVSDLLLAVPELSKGGLSANFFICAGRIGKAHYLDRAMLEELRDRGMGIGSHGMDHRDWRTLDASDLDREITDARRKLEDAIQRPVTTVSIPFGSYDRRVLSRLMRDRWDFIYTCDRGLARSGWQIKPRETLCVHMLDSNLLKKLAHPKPRMRLQRMLSRLFHKMR